MNKKVVVIILIIVVAIFLMYKLTNNKEYSITATVEETKDGVYVGNVLIPDEVLTSVKYQKEEYVSKKVKVTGTIEEVEQTTKETDENGNAIYTQGREGTTLVFKTIDTFEIQKE